ncbi:MAG TPA: adenosylmethionine decarboxylase [Caldisericia bacterium]|nr:adenosylmethionine decarboxylase [Caldisericia bacterium]OQB74171.1 MAG: S-adenosylmethionine decarboxylase proenzyme precursor [bacterium ADurb.Bin132]HNY61547.1 adenosylmethionine decarboxylase [Caldisericia bacterium]HOC79218.1 adenosylmethionine decarboxylase [Caldisericia bacterium]HOG70519.1 adenosylmethionine decarboxylase [Caldisericia bacterium]
MYTYGRHLLCEVSGCDPSIIGDVDKVKEILYQAAGLAKAEIMESTFHHFSPQGVSGVVVIAESHLSIHTWPEFGYAALDIYTCGEHTDPEGALNYCSEKFGASEVDITRIERGLKEETGGFSHRLSNVGAA